MTAPDEVLEGSFASGNPITLYRLASLEFATLAGTGAAAYPGRWNRLGQRALYTSIEKATRVLERLAHQADKLLIPDDLVMMAIEFAGMWEQEGDLLLDRGTGGRFGVFPSLQQARTAMPSLSFDYAADIVAIAVPSVILPVWNFVLFPEARSFARHVSVDRLLPFDFDPRLFPEGAVAAPTKRSRKSS